MNKDLQGLVFARPSINQLFLVLANEQKSTINNLNYIIITNLTHNLQYENLFQNTFL